MAWRRTSLTFMICIGLLVRTVIVDHEGPAGAVAAACGALAWAGFLVLAQRRTAVIRRSSRPSAPVAGTVTGGMLCVLVIAAAAAVLLV